MSSRRAFLIAQTEQPLFWRLNPRQRARAAAGLALVVFLGAILVLFAWWGGRVARRYVNRERPVRGKHSRSGHVDDWADKPLYKEDQEA